jgi:pyrimidine deaminase RibD-like protein/RNA-binding protein YhbY
MGSFTVRVLVKLLLSLHMIKFSVLYRAVAARNLPAGFSHHAGLSQNSRRKTTHIHTARSDGDTDEKFLLQAVKCAEKGLGRTFPNPAVGCVLVNQNTGNVIGSGFHPRAGFPHAEIFALLEAAGHIESGLAAADAVVRTEGKVGSEILQFVKKYSSEGGPAELFADSFSEIPVTAYVTLEPCCHFGLTPPCASALALAKISRVVVGFRDPNPRVDGGGVSILENAGIQVDLSIGLVSNEACKNLVTNFCKRITPRPELGEDYDYINGKLRRSIRAAAGRLMHEKSLSYVDWGGDSVEVNDDIETAVSSLTLKPEWMEHVDSMLWKHELLLLKLNKAVAKKKGAKLLGDRIAHALTAHVAQSKGHTILLYRPGIPPVLDFENFSV